MQEIQPPSDDRIDPTEALKAIRALLDDMTHASGEKLVDATLREVRNVLREALGEDRRPRRTTSE